MLRGLRRLIPITDTYHGERFFTRENGRRVATPLFASLVLVESADVVFAVDSVPAVFAVTREPFLVFSSNVFAIIGLRAVYFLLADLMHRFVHLKLGLALVLVGVGVGVGVKMLLVEVYPVPLWVSLSFIAVTLTGCITASLHATRGHSDRPRDDATTSDPAPSTHVGKP